MLIIGQPDEMLRDLRNSKGITELSAMSLELLLSVVNHKISLCFHSVCHSAWSRYEIQQGHYFIASLAHPPSVLTYIFH